MAVYFVHLKVWFDTHFMADEPFTIFETNFSTELNVQWAR